MLNFEELPSANSERWLSLENLPGEIWKDVAGFEERHQISNYGRVKSKPFSYYVAGRIYKAKEKILILRESYQGYWRVGFRTPKNSKKKFFFIHRLVADAFIPKIQGKDYVDHINTIRKDNRFVNLRWVTCKENSNNNITRQRLSTYSELAGKHRIVMLDIKGNYIMTFGNSARAAEYFGFSKGVLTAINEIATRQRKNAKTYKGYQFVLEKDYNPEKDYSLKYTCWRHAEKLGVPCSTSVALFVDGRMVQVFLNAKIAGETLGVKAKTIREICKLNGYNFEYKGKMINGQPKYFKFLNESEKEEFYRLLKQKD